VLIVNSKSQTSTVLLKM